MTKKRHHHRHNRNATQEASRNQDTAANGDGDMLSKLPNDLLLNILERVDTLDAVRTCILSKQMLKLPTMLSHFFVSVSSSPCRHGKARVFSLNDAFRTNHAVAHVTDNILSTRRPEITISKLKIRFLLVHEDCLTIGRCVAHAMATQKVGAAEFEILTEKTYGDCSTADLFHFGKMFNNFVGACPDAFAGLSRLWLRNMKFGELDIPSILSTCELLESLRLSYCDSGIHSVLQVEHAQLVELEVDYGEFERVELICVPKLQRLSKLSLTKTGVRSEKILELSHLLANVPSISDLHLDFESENIWVVPECPKLLRPVLSNLQQVNLENLPEGCDLAWTMFILEASGGDRPQAGGAWARSVGIHSFVNCSVFCTVEHCSNEAGPGPSASLAPPLLEAAPSLKEMCITVWDHWCIIMADKEYRKKNGFCEKADVKWKPYAPDFKHKNLVRLTIYGFQPDNSFVRYIRCVMEHAVNMTDISLHDRKVCGSCGNLDPKIKDKVCPSRYPRTKEERDRTTEGLGLASRAVIHFES